MKVILDVFEYLFQHASKPAECGSCAKIINELRTNAMHIQCGSRLRMATVYLFLTLPYIEVQCSYICIDCHLFCRTTSLGGAVAEGDCGPPQDKSGGTSTANQCQVKGSERGGEVYTEHDTQPPYSYIP